MPYELVDPRDGSILHEPPCHSELPQRLQRLCDFANANESASPFVPPVLRAILLHFMIGYDHPFADGNGRTARALFYWSIARSGYWLMEYTSISHIIRRAPAKYMRAYLHSESDAGQNKTGERLRFLCAGKSAGIVGGAGEGIAVFPGERALS